MALGYIEVIKNQKFQETGGYIYVSVLSLFNDTIIDLSQQTNITKILKEIIQSYGFNVEIVGNVEDSENKITSKEYEENKEILIHLPPEGSELTLSEEQYKNMLLALWKRFTEEGVGIECASPPDGANPILQSDGQNSPFSFQLNFSSPDHPLNRIQFTQEELEQNGIENNGASHDFSPLPEQKTSKPTFSDICEKVKEGIQTYKNKQSLHVPGPAWMIDSDTGKHRCQIFEKAFTNKEFSEEIKWVLIYALLHQTHGTTLRADVQTSLSKLGKDYKDLKTSRESLFKQLRDLFGIVNSPIKKSPSKFSSFPKFGSKKTLDVIFDEEVQEDSNNQNPSMEKREFDKAVRGIINRIEELAKAKKLIDFDPNEFEILKKESIKLVH